MSALCSLINALPRPAARRIIQKHLVNIKKYMGQPVPGCTATAASS